MGMMLTSAVKALCIVGSLPGAPDRSSLHVLECDTQTGEAKIVQSVCDLAGTTYFRFSNDGKTLYSVARKEDSPLSVAVGIPFADSRLQRHSVIADLPCEAPCHVELSPDGKTFSFAAYLSGTAGTLGVGDGASGAEVKSVVLPDVGMGPHPSRQKKAYAHCTFYTPDGSTMGVIDLGCDAIHFFDPSTMKPKESMTIKSDPGDGPRHAVFSKDGKCLFVLNELSSTVTGYAFDGTSFRRVCKRSMLPSDCGEVETKAAAIKLTSDGRVLMASNRGHDSIAFFEVGEGGEFELRNVAKLTGSFPRDFELMPGERFMVVGHKMSDEIRIYRFVREKFALEPVGPAIPCYRPLCFKFAR